MVSNVWRVSSLVVGCRNTLTKQVCYNGHQDGRLSFVITSFKAAVSWPRKPRDLDEKLESDRNCREERTWGFLLVLFMSENERGPNNFLTRRCLSSKTWVVGLHRHHHFFNLPKSAAEGSSIEMCSEMVMSPPRLSFSHDFICTRTEPFGSHPASHFSAPNSEFEFSFMTQNDEQEPSSADELFCNGVIVPIRSTCTIQISENPSKGKPPFSPSLRNLPPLPQKTSIVGCCELEQKQRPKSFWGFRRSSSLNFESQRTPLSPISLLSRSNSTGSNPNQKGPNSKQNHRKSPDPSLFHYSKSSAQKKIQRGFYGSYIWITPVLNLPPPYISKGTSNLFGFGSCLGNGKAKQSKKWNFFSVIG